MPILNYTTDVPVDRTIREVLKMLVKNGAYSVTQEYGKDSRITALSFLMKVRTAPVRYLLPANPEGVYKSLKSDGRRVSFEQAERVSWRILKDWIEAQIALIESGQAESAQVFLPYAQQADGRTMYELFIENHQRQLPEETPHA